MTTTLEVVPGLGIGPIRLGMTPDEVRHAMGEPGRGSVPGAWWYWNGVLLVNAPDDDPHGPVSYLEVSRDPDVRVVYKGVPVLEVPPDEAAMIVCPSGAARNRYLCADIDADVGMSSCDAERWDAIGIGTGSRFRTIWEHELELAEQKRRRAVRRG